MLWYAILLRTKGKYDAMSERLIVWFIKLVILRPSNEEDKVVFGQFGHLYAQNQLFSSR